MDDATNHPPMIRSNSQRLSLWERLHYCHRFLRYQFRSEPDTVRLIREELRPGQVALDIGANKGIVTCFLAKQTGPDGRVIAFEPQPELVGQIEKVTRGFGLQNVETHGIGLSDSDGTQTLYRGEAGRTANMVAGSSWQDDSVEVKTLSLDSFAESNGLDKIDFIKCDVDGFESKVFRGAKNVLRNYGPKVLVEIAERNFREMLAIFRESGYDDGIFWHKGSRFPSKESNSVPFRKPTAKWRNYLFCRLE